MQQWTACRRQHRSKVVASPSPFMVTLCCHLDEMVVWCEDKQQWRLSGAEEKAASNNVRLMVDGTRCGGGGTISLI